MNRKLLLSISMLAAFATTAVAQIRYVEPVFTRSNVKMSNDVWYADGYSVISGSPKLDSLYMDVYEPNGDAVAKRPLIIYCHTGSFLPRYMNGLTTGANDDSATVEMCKQFAMKGYVVASIEYRAGWNPYASTEELRKSSIINAAYKGIQDLNTAVRYFKNSVANGNMWKIDSTKICLGGQGTGGYLTLAAASLDRQAEITIDKFWDYTLNQPMVRDVIWGDRNGLPVGSSPYSRNNYANHTSNGQVAFSMGGAMGDTSWLEDGEIPIISAHGIYDPFAPYRTGMVKVPGTNLNVVEVSGGYDVTYRADMYGNNDVFKNKVCDKYTKRAYELNDSLDGLFPIAGIANGAGAWEWWDSTYLRMYLAAGGLSPTQITTINSNSSLSNPLMSKTRALKYIDSIQGYFSPRIAIALGLITKYENGAFCVNGTSSLNNLPVTVSPNPSFGRVRISNEHPENIMTGAQLLNLNGQSIRNFTISGTEADIQLNVSPGVYFLKVDFQNGTAVQKLVIQ